MIKNKTFDAKIIFKNIKNKAKIFSDSQTNFYSTKYQIF